MQEFFAVVVAISTVVYVCLTLYLVVETRKMRRVQTEPKIGISIVQSEHAFGFADLMIRNDGAGPALDLKFEIVITPEGATPDAEILKTLAALGAIKTGIPYMSPGAEYRAYFGQMVGRSDAEMATHLHLKVTYRSVHEEQYDDCYPVDLLPYTQRRRIGTPVGEQVVGELAAIRKQLERLRTGSTSDL
ncbi:MAG TPA: hypothetical protein VF219_07355 [Vicinamibacterales bacterium]